MRSIARLCLAVASLWAAVSPSAAGALPVLTHHGRWLVDPQGRVVILHGAQIDRFRPGTVVEYIDLPAVNLRFLASEGFNVARVSLAYAGVEPRLHRLDQRYVNGYLRFDRELAGAGVYDLLDIMQGQYSALVGGWGFPDWMTRIGSSPNNPTPFPDGYFENPAQQAAWDAFWSDAPAADGTGLLDHFAAGLHRLAGQFGRSPGLLGIEVLNEPWPGSRYAACASPAGCPAGGFDQTSFTAAYRRLIPAIRSADPHHLILYEPNLLFDYGAATQLGALRDPNLVFAFHSYCLAYAGGLPDPFGNCSTDEQLVFRNAEARARATGDGLLMDEWGNVTDIPRVQRTAAEADAHMVGWAVWSLEDCCHSPAAILADGSKPATAPGNLRASVLRALARAYPKAIAGTPETWSYDPASRRFTLRYTARSVSGEILRPAVSTQIELPALDYPTGYSVGVRGGRVVSAPDANLLIVRRLPHTDQLSLTVMPARHHPAGPGPFSWPAGLAMTGDCPSARRLSFMLRRSASAVFVDGRRVGIAGSGPGRVELPPGLADGSVIRAGAEVRRVRHCRIAA